MFEVTNLSQSYEDETIINNISFKVSNNNIVGIIGPNGAGKSTLIKTILNLVKRDSGEVFFNDQLLTNNQNIAYIPQRNDLNLNFPITVIDVVLMGLYPANGLFKRTTKEDVEKAMNVLEKVDMLEYKNRQIGKLSEGQQQRVFLARALIQDAEVLFLDEPFVGVDMKTEKLIIDILKEEKLKGKLIFIVHHDLTKVHDYFDKILLLNKNLISFGKVDEAFSQNNLAKTYSFKLEEGEN